MITNNRIAKGILLRLATQHTQLPASSITNYKDGYKMVTKQIQASARC